MIKYIILTLLLIAACDTSPGLDAPPELPEPDAFGVPVDSVTVSVSIDQGYSGHYQILYPGMDVWEGYSLDLLPTDGRNRRADTTFYATRGDSIGIGIDVEMLRSGGHCIFFEAIQEGTDQVLIKGGKCSYGFKEFFRGTVIVP